MNDPSTPTPSPARSGAFAKPITLSDLTEDLLWPLLFRAVPLALRPERLGIAFFGLLIARLLGRLIPNAGDAPTAAWPMLSQLLSAVRAGDWRSCLYAELAWVIGVPWESITEHRWIAAAVGLPALIVLVIAAGAVSRMAACEFSQSVMLPWTRGLGFAVSRWATLTGSVLGPLMVAGLFLGLIALAGGAMFNWSVSAVLGALVYPLLLLLGALAVLALAGFAFGHSLLIPAVACEGTDAIDAIQRSYAYVVGRPLRLVLYQALLWTTLLIAVYVLDRVAWATTGYTAAAAKLLVGTESATSLAADPQATGGAWGAAARIISFWNAIPHLLVGAFIFSYGSTASTILYLLLRKLNDGQDSSEIWMPGMIGGTLAPDVVAPGETAPEGEDSDDE